MPRDKSGNAARKAEDRQKRLAPPKSEPKGGRERNVKHPAGKSEEHSRVPKGNRG